MAFNRRSGTGWVAATTLKRRSGSSWVDIETIRRRLSGAWITVYSRYSPLTVSVPNASGTDQDIVSPYDSSRTVYATAVPSVAGGNGSHTVSYTKISGTTMTVSGNTFSANVPANTMVSAVYRCTVSDGISSAYDDFTVSLTFNSGQVN